MFQLGEENPLVNIDDEEIRRLFRIFNKDITDEEEKEILKRLKAK